MTEEWALPGYDVQALIGDGATGQVWLARELATCTAVALRRLRPDADPGAIEALRREIAVLRTLDTPYVVGLRAVVEQGADTVLVLDLAPGGSLAALLARRGSLDPGEVVTIAAPLAQALAAAHARGLVHGNVTPSNVLFTAAGMPLLADLGLTRFAGEFASSADGQAAHLDAALGAGGAPSAAADVWGLAAVCRHMLCGTPPQPLAAVIESALQADPSVRPDAAAFAVALLRSQAAAPVRLAVGVSLGAPGPQARRAHPDHPRLASAPPAGPAGRWRRLLVGAAAVALLAVAACIGWLSGRSGDPATASVAALTPDVASSSPPGAAVPDWAAELDRLDAARAAAFAAADPSELAAVYAPSSSLLFADRGAIERLRTSGQRALGVRHAVRSAAATSYDASRATLRVVDALAAYVVTDGTGRVLTRTAPRGPRTFTVTLVKTPDGWRLQSVVPG